MGQALLCHDRGQFAAAVAAVIVGEQLATLNALHRVPGESAREKAGNHGAHFVIKDLTAADARTVVDNHVLVVPDDL